MSVSIPLTTKACAIIDETDAELVRRHPWHLHAHGHLRYARTYVRETGKKRRAISMHRLIMGFPEGKMVDHIDGNGLNNRRANLRVATRGQNKANSTKRKASASPFKGVFRRGERWGAQLMNRAASNAPKKLGYFSTQEQAARAYDAAAKAAFGAFARLNFPEAT